MWHQTIGVFFSLQAKFNFRFLSLEQWKAQNTHPFSAVNWWHVVFIFKYRYCMKKPTRNRDTLSEKYLSGSQKQVCLPDSIPRHHAQRLGTGGSGSRKENSQGESWKHKQQARRNRMLGNHWNRTRTVASCVFSKEMKLNQKACATRIVKTWYEYFKALCLDKSVDYGVKLERVLIRRARRCKQQQLRQQNRIQLFSIVRQPSEPYRSVLCTK